MEWGLTMTQRETEAIIEMLDTCEEPIEVEAGRAEGSSSLLPESSFAASAPESGAHGWPGNGLTQPT